MRDEADRTHTEAALLDASLRGDIDAFAQLYAGYRAALLRHCTEILKDVGLAEDVVQETFLRAFTCLPRFNVERRLWPWLVTIAQRQAIDVLRARARTVCTDDHDGARAEARSLGSDQVDEPFEAVVASEARAELAQALEVLSPRQRRTLLMRAVEEWPYADIASAEGISVSATKSLLFHARTNLRRACSRRGLYGTLIAGLAALRRRVARRATTIESRVAGSYEPIASSFASVSSGVVAVVMSLMTATAPSLAATPGAALAGAPGVSNERAWGSTAGNRFAASSVPRSRPIGLASSLLNPTRNATPEQTQFTSVAASPNYHKDHTLVASGQVSCPQVSCAVLFISRNGGRSWNRIPSRNFHGTAVFLPPSYPADQRIFAMGPSGLEMSKDGGRQFERVLALSGDAAISPLFDGPDPRVVVGATVVTEYWADRNLAKPATLIGPAGTWLTVAFSPEYATDHVLYIGGIRPDTTGTMRPTVNRCADSICDSVVFDAGFDAPFIRPSSNFARDQAVYAFTGHALFRSVDAGRTFTSSEPAFARNGTIYDVQMVRDGVVLVAVAGPDRATSGLYRSSDGGLTWMKRAVRVSGFEAGVARVVVLPDGGLIALASERGIACSSDGGRRWTSRCGA